MKNVATIGGVGVLLESGLRELAKTEDGPIAEVLIQAAEELERLREEAREERHAKEKAEQSLKLVQTHAKLAIDALPERYGLGVKHGKESAEKTYISAVQEVQALRERLAEENAMFTKEIMELEAQIETLKRGVS